MAELAYDLSAFGLHTFSLLTLSAGNHESLSREVPYTSEQLASFGLERESMPRHIAVIMDGNGRWAQERGLPRIEGHRRGVTSVREIVEESSRLGMEQLTLFCFSSENWKRPPNELSFLMRLLKKYVVEERRRIKEQGLQFRVIGHVEELHTDIQDEISATIEESANNDGMTLCLALNYGARAEIAHAMQQIAGKVQQGKLQPEDITDETVAEHLMTAGMPDPDLVIRTANEMRISNFLLWQISYAEIWITETYWPEFRNPHLRNALQEFARRDRRYGGLNTPSATTPQN